MKDSVIALIQETLSLGSGPELKLKQAFGGDICSSFVLVGDEGPSQFVKAGPPSFHNLFAAEQQGLETLAASNSLRVPKALCVASNDDVALLVMEHLNFGLKTESAQRALGEGLANLHRETHTQFGFYKDNFIGKTPQENSWRDDWVDFWLECRLQPQLDLLAMQGAAAAFLKVADAFCTRLSGLLKGHRPAASLLHGDLWSGNAAALEDGTPCIFDPAVYYGDRETDLAMTRLFGGFSPAFYQRYLEVLPLETGWEERQDFYNLYHVLNHANLFGGGYFLQAQTLMQKYL